MYIMQDDVTHAKQITSYTQIETKQTNMHILPSSHPLFPIWTCVRENVAARFVCMPYICGSACIHG